MGGPIPCLGYPSRTAAVVALRAEGMTTREIASRVGIEAKKVTALEGSMARGDRSPARVLPANTLAIPMLTRQALRPHAARRGVSVERLALQLLEVLTDDDLVDALLDDEVQ